MPPSARAIACCCGSRSPRCAVPDCDGASSNLTRQQEGGPWQASFTAALVRRRVVEPSSKGRKTIAPLPPPADGTRGRQGALPAVEGDLPVLGHHHGGEQCLRVRCGLILQLREDEDVAARHEVLLAGPEDAAVILVGDLAPSASPDRARCQDPANASDSASSCGSSVVIVPPRCPVAEGGGTRQPARQRRSATVAAWDPKARPTFSDALAAVRRAIWREQHIQTSPRRTALRKNPFRLSQAWADVLCNAA